jgi:hypothetical protein
MALYNEILPDWCHAAFSRDRKLYFPLPADFEPKGAPACLEPF